MAVEELEPFANPSLHVVHRIVVAAGIVVERPYIVTLEDAPSHLITLGSSPTLQKRRQGVHGLHEAPVGMVALPILLPPMLQFIHIVFVLKHPVPVERHIEIVPLVMEVQLILPAVGILSTVIVTVAPCQVEVPQGGLPSRVESFGFASLLTVLV